MACLEDLPTELKYKVLKYLRDGNSLGELTQASKQYHLAYSVIHEEVLAHVTLSELAARGIDFRQEASMMEFCFKGGLTDADVDQLKAAIEQGLISS